MRIAFLGACGTGKTTLVESLYKELRLKPVYNNARNVMSGLGIIDLTDVENTKRALLCESILITRLTKQLELNAFAGIPHMLIPDVITRADHAAMMLEWACEEMERRYAVMKKFNETYNCALKNISDFNERQEVKAGLYEKIPYQQVI